MDKNNKPWYKKFWVISLIFFISIFLFFLIIFGFYVFNNIKNINSSNNIAQIKFKPISEKTKKLAEGNKNNYWFGSAKPKITIVEFGDFACPHCQKTFTTIREIGLQYGQKVKIIFRDFPVITDYSSDLSLAARCAGEQGLFWPMYDKLYINQGIKNKTKIMALANQVGVDENRFKKCYNNKKYLVAIRKDLSDGQKLGVAGTPTWFINGYKIAGDIPYNIFVKIINQLLNKG